MSPSKDDLQGAVLEKGDMIRDGLTGGHLDDLFFGGGGILGGSPGLTGLNEKLGGTRVGANPLAALFAASNAGGLPSPVGIQQVNGR